MTMFETAVSARGDDLRQRIAATKRTRAAFKDWSTGKGLELTRLIKMYTELLVVIEKHERIAQLARVLATECA